MLFVEKFPSESREIFAQYDLQGDELDSSTWAIEPAGEATFSNEVFSKDLARASVEGGEDGTFYHVRNISTTAGGATYTREFLVGVGDIYSEPEDLTRNQVFYRVRLFMRDRPEINTLNKNRMEFTKGEVMSSISAALSDWNSTPPLTSRTIKDFPVQGRHLLYMRAVIELLRSLAAGKSRNQINYNDQGFGVQENDQSPLLMNIAQQLTQEYEMKKERVKMAINVNSFWGGQHGDIARSGYNQDTLSY